MTEFLREAAQKVLQIAIEHEVERFIESYQNKTLEDGKQRVVRNGYLPERSIQTGIGDIDVSVPRVRDREQKDQDKIEFKLSWLPKYMRRTATLDCMLPLLYLKISTNDFQAVLEPILGLEAANLSPQVISRMKTAWYKEY